MKADECYQNRQTDINYRPDTTLSVSIRSLGARLHPENDLKADDVDRTRDMNTTIVLNAIVDYYCLPAREESSTARLLNEKAITPN